MSSEKQQPLFSFPEASANAQSELWKLEEDSRHRQLL